MSRNGAGTLHRGPDALRRSRAALTPGHPARSIRTQPKSSYQEWQRDRPDEATTTYRHRVGKVPSPGRSACEIRELPSETPFDSLRSVRPAGPPGHPSTPGEPMAIETRPSASHTPPGNRDRASSAWRCRNCRRSQPIGLSYVCAACFGPLEVEYDYAVVARTLTREAIAARKPGIWRYAELLPVEVPPTRGLPVGSTPLTTADRLAPTLGLDRLWLKDDTRNPSLSFKDRAVAVAAAGPWSSASRRSPAPPPATWPARRPPPRPRSGCRPTSSSRPTSSRPRWTTPWPMARRSSRSTEPTTTSTACASRSPTRPAGASSTSTCGRSTPKVRRPSRYEIAESLGWRSPDVVVAPVASGAMFTRLARGFEELVELGLIESPAAPLRRWPGRRLRAGRDGLGGRHGRHRTGPRARHDRPLARDRQPGRRPVRGPAGQRERRLDRSDRGRGRPPKPSARSPGSRGSTPRPPVA